MQTKRNLRRGVIVAAAVLIIAGGLFLLLRSDTGKSRPQDISSTEAPLIATEPTHDAAVTDDGPEHPTEEEILAELNRVVAESMITMSMNPDPMFETGTAQGSLLIHNDEANRHAQVVRIVRDDTDATVYTSGVIPVGKYVNSDALDAALPAGDYPCTAYFDAVDESGTQTFGTGAVKITVHIAS